MLHDRHPELVSGSFQHASALLNSSHDATRLMATITADNIASVSLKDADRDPDGFAQKLGRSFEEYGFAIIADHGIPDELIHRAEEKAKAFFALPEEVKRKYLIPGGGGARGYTPFGIETAKGAQGARPQGILARRPRPARRATSSATTCPTMSGRPKCRASRTRSWSSSRPSTAPASRSSRRSPATSSIDEDYFVDTVRDGNSVLRAAPLSAADRADRRAHPRRRARGHQHHHLAARRRGSGARAADPRRPLDPGLAQARRAGRSTSATCCSG